MHWSQGQKHLGRLFENVVVNEVKAFNSYNRLDLDIAYWKLTSGAEVDLVIPEHRIANEIKSSTRILPKHL